MDYNLSYIIETNGDNGVKVEYRLIDYTPSGIEWVNNVNSFNQIVNLPDPEAVEAPDYVRKNNGTDFDYYRRAVILPSKSCTFSLIVLVNGSEGISTYSYEVFSSSLSYYKNGTSIVITVIDNLGNEEIESSIVVSSNEYEGVSLPIWIIQEVTHIGMSLVSYSSKDASGTETGIINNINFTHVFHYLTNKKSPSNETLTVNVSALGFKNDFIIRSVEKFASKGGLDDRYAFSPSTGKCYELVQVWNNGILEKVTKEVFYDSENGYVYKQTPFDNDFNVFKFEKSVEITNYGRCFLEDDAYYIITLSNVDEIRNLCSITIKYEPDVVTTQMLSNFSTSSSTSSYEEA